MDIPIWVSVVSAVILSAVAIWTLLKIDEYKENSRRQFKNEMIKAVLHTQPSWREMLDMADTSNVSAGTTYTIARQLHKDILTGADSDLHEHRQLIESYIAAHKRAEPFEGLPNEIRIHLERLRDSLSGSEHLLEPLTIQIRELLSIHAKEFKAQKRYTSWGFIIAVVSVLFAAFAYFYPYAGASSVVQRPTESHE